MKFVVIDDGVCVGRCLWSMSIGIECGDQMGEIFCKGFLWLGCSVVYVSWY